MPAAISDIPTTEAARLVQRLCTHWAHKFAVEFDAGHGLVPFDPQTTARLRATEAQLHVRVEAAGAATLARYQAVVEAHLQRMARAGALVVAWQPAGDA